MVIFVRRARSVGPVVVVNKGPYGDCPSTPIITKQQPDIALRKALYAAVQLLGN
jgi:hypothetical protein